MQKTGPPECHDDENGRKQQTVSFQIGASFSAQVVVSECICTVGHWKLGHCARGMSGTSRRAPVQTYQAPQATNWWKQVIEVSSRTCTMCSKFAPPMLALLA
eukprot:3966217-Amphidinium_carterae.1